MRVAIALVPLVTAGLAAADWSGEWSGRMKAEGVPGATVFLTLQQRGEEISGTIAFAADAGSVPIRSVQPRGDRLTFQAPDIFNHTVNFDLAASDCCLTGEATSEGQTIRIVLSQAPPPGVVSLGGTPNILVSPPGSSAAPLSPPGGAYRVGGGVSAPIPRSMPPPNYSEEGRRARMQGAVILAVQVSAEGKATNIRVIHPLGLGLDEEAMKCVREWTFSPGMKDGQAVAVEAQIQVNFRLPDNSAR